MPVNFTAANPCTGEDIDFSGTVNVVDHVTFDPSGGFHLHRSFARQGITGVGQTTGNVYQLAGAASRTTYSDAPLPFEFTVVSTRNVISRGSADNFQIRFREHTTVNANGTTTVIIDSFSLVCGG